MFTRLPLPWEVLLLAVFALVFVLVVRAVRGRRRFAAPAVVGAAELPRVETDVRVTGTIRRTFRDPAQGVWMAVAQIGPTARLTFCATDYDANKERYESLIGKPADLVLFALSKLEEGGADAIRDQIKDADKLALGPNTVALSPAGQFPNDHAVIGRVVSSRPDTWDDLALTVYRTQVANGPNLTLMLDLAVPSEDRFAPFAPGTMVHGSARLFGHLA